MSNRDSCRLVVRMAEREVYRTTSDERRGCPKYVDILRTATAEANDGAVSSRRRATQFREGLGGGKPLMQPSAPLATSVPNTQPIAPQHRKFPPSSKLRSSIPAAPYRRPGRRAAVERRTIHGFNGFAKIKRVRIPDRSCTEGDAPGRSQIGLFARRASNAGFFAPRSDCRERLCERLGGPKTDN